MNQCSNSARCVHAAHRADRRGPRRARALAPLGSGALTYVVTARKFLLQTAVCSLCPSSWLVHLRCSWRAHSLITPTPSILGIIVTHVVPGQSRSTRATSSATQPRLRATCGIRCPRARPSRTVPRHAVATGAVRHLHSTLPRMRRLCRRPRRQAAHSRVTGSTMTHCVATLASL